MNFLYDGTFEGYLTCVYEHYYKEKADDISSVDEFQESILVQSETVETDSQKSDRVYNAIVSKISSYDLMRIYKTLGSIVSDREMKCLRYLELGFKIGSKIQLLHGNPIVFDVEEADKKVAREIHRLHGLIRFSVVKPAGSLRPEEQQQEILYTKIEPDNDIVEFLVHHFKDRYRNNPFIIHDEKRGKAVVYGAGKWYVTDFSDTSILEYTDNENEYQRLWKMYFDTMAIKERINPRCQKNFMPVRYWKNLTEIDSGNSLNKAIR